MLRAKDLFTLGNLLCGAAAIVFCIEHRGDRAAVAMILAYAFDALDGRVAKWTGGGNRFGAELDNLSDYFAFGIAPGFLVYEAYRSVEGVPGAAWPGWPWVGIALGALLVVASTVRHVRNLVFEVPTTLCWVGLPRPGAALMIVSFVQSSLYGLLGPWVGTPLVLGAAWGLVSTHPCMNHHGRAIQPWVRALVVAWLATSAAAALFLPRYFWDVLLFWTCAYALFSWVALEPEEMADYRRTVAEWRQKVARGLAAHGRP